MDWLRQTVLVQMADKLLAGEEIVVSVVDDGIGIGYDSEDS